MLVMMMWCAGDVPRFGAFWLPWLTTAESGSCRLKSAAAIDAGDVPVGHDANECPKMRSARVQMCNSRCPRWPILPSESVAVAVESFWWAGGVVTRLDPLPLGSWA